MGILLRRYRKNKNSVNFEVLSLKELRQLAEQNGIKMTSKMTKEDMINILKEV